MITIMTKCGYKNCNNLFILHPQLQDLADGSGLTPDLVRYWFSTKASLHRTGQSAPAEAAGDAAAEPTRMGSSPLEPQPGGGTEEKMEQSVCGVSTDAEEADKTVKPTKGRNHVTKCDQTSAFGHGKIVLKLLSSQKCLG